MFRLAKSLAALRTSLSYCDAIVFTGGIGEHNPWLREAVLKRLSFLVLKLISMQMRDMAAETNGCISAESSSVAAYVIPTNEELMIAKETSDTLLNA